MIKRDLIRDIESSDLIFGNFSILPVLYASVEFFPFDRKWLFENYFKMIKIFEPWK